MCPAGHTKKATLIPAEVQAKPDDYKCIGERHHDELDYQPAHLQWLRTIIPTYILKEDKSQPPVRAKAPESRIPGTMITPALATALIIDKHCDHLPHYRQAQRFFREQTAEISRKFIDDKSLRKLPSVAYLLRAIKVLYRIERRLRNTSSPPDECNRIRQTYAKPIVEKFHKILNDELPQHRPSSNCGKAITYALNQWSQFILYLEDGRLPIDNNGAENAIRPCKLGLKNYLFFGSLEAGENNAILYTLIENCKASGLNPRDYLEYVLENIRSQPAEELTPNKVAGYWARLAAA